MGSKFPWASPFFFAWKEDRKGLANSLEIEVQELTSFFNFYHHFIKNFSWVACPLYTLTKKDEKFEWMENNKRLLTSSKI